MKVYATLKLQKLGKITNKLLYSEQLCGAHTQLWTMQQLNILVVIFAATTYEKEVIIFYNTDGLHLVSNFCHHFTSIVAQNEDTTNFCILKKTIFCSKSKFN